MKRWLLAAWAMMAFPLMAGDWKQTLTTPEPGKFPPLRSLKIQYRFGWSAFTAAEATFDFSGQPGDKRKLEMNTKTTGPVRALWRMDAEHTAWCEATSLRPIRLQQREIYSWDTEKVRTEFSNDGVDRVTESTSSGNTPSKKHFALPHPFDLQTALLFIRSQPLHDRDNYRLVVFPARSAYLADVTVIDREKLAVAGKEFPAIKCEVRLQSITKQQALKPDQKFKRAFAWLSDDADRLLLKIEAQIFVGSVWAEMESVRWTE